MSSVRLEVTFLGDLSQITSHSLCQKCTGPKKSCVLPSLLFSLPGLFHAHPVLVFILGPHCALCLCFALAAISVSSPPRLALCFYLRYLAPVSHFLPLGSRLYLMTLSLHFPLSSYSTHPLLQNFRCFFFTMSGSLS